MESSNVKQAEWTKKTDARQPVFHVSKYWRTAVEVGLKTCVRPGRRVEAIKRAVNPLSFPRPAEFRAALYDLAPRLQSGRVLDIGSPKLPAIVLAGERPELELHVTDIMPDFIPSTHRFLEAAGYGHRLGKTIHLRAEDARGLSYPDNTFDWVYSISVLEHVADQCLGDEIVRGDSLALREIARVLRPGGVVTLTVPYDPTGYWEEFTEGPVYERTSAEGGKTFYQRHYDQQAFEERLIAASGLNCDAKMYLGEAGRFKVEPWWNQIPMKLKAPLLPLQGFAGNLLFTPLPDDQVKSARGLALRLSKPVA
jgi:SAM-dependent methyltransferase